MKKQSLVGKNGSNEKFLFHATGGDKVDAINKHGLNRNYYSGLKGNEKYNCYYNLATYQGLCSHAVLHTHKQGSC